MGRLAPPYSNNGVLYGQCDNWEALLGILDAPHVIGSPRQGSGFQSHAGLSMDQVGRLFVYIAYEESNTHVDPDHDSLSCVAKATCRKGCGDDLVAPNGHQGEGHV